MNTKKQNIRSIQEMHRRFSDEVKISGLAEGEKIVEHNLSDVKINSIVTDSRRVTPGSAFFAIRGLKSNGEDFVEDAVKRGAKAIIAENFDYTLKLFEKKEESRLESLKEQALEDTTKVDRVVEEKVETTVIDNPYMSELSKY